MISRTNWMRTFAMLLPWVLLAIGLWMVYSQVARPAFLISAGDVKARIGCLAIVMTAIIITGGIDLSVGSMLALCTVVMASLWQSGVSPEVSAAAALLVGVVAGAFNGALVCGGLSPLVATLATMAFYRGLAVTIAGGTTYYFNEDVLGVNRIAGWPGEYWLFMLLVIVGVVLLHFTRWGRWCFAIGDNPMAARYAAIPVTWTKLSLYVASGLVAALLAIIYTTRKGANPEEHAGLELEAIACVVVGGTLITGGRGGVYLSLLGIAVVSSLDMGLLLLNAKIRVFPAEARLMVVGALLIFVAVGNQWVAKEDQKHVSNES